MKHPSYCCGFMRDIRDQTILLVRKQKPDWQRGRLNGIGGAIEENETPLNAMIREWHEEAGFDYRDWRLFARLHPKGRR